MKETNIISRLHKRTKRNYLARVTETDKPHCIRISRKYGFDYWDGDRQYGYGGYKYDGRWADVAKEFIKHYDLTENSKILDVGCGKGFLLHEFKQLLPRATVAGVDISSYAIENAKPEIKQYLKVGNATRLDFPDKSFDLVLANGCHHNLKIGDLFQAVLEMQRVSAKHAWICVESFRNEEEQVNLQNWSLTAQAFFSTDEWEWIYKHCGYTGDYEFIFFE